MTKEVVNFLICQEKVGDIVCGASFPNAEDLLMHSLVFHPTTALFYPCDQCSKSYMTPLKLGKHKRDIHGPKYQCPEVGCNYQTALCTKKRIAKHKDTHEKQQSLQVQTPKKSVPSLLDIKCSPPANLALGKSSGYLTKPSHSPSASVAKAQDPKPPVLKPVKSTKKPRTKSNELKFKKKVKKNLKTWDKILGKPTKINSNESLEEELDQTVVVVPIMNDQAIPSTSCDSGDQSDTKNQALSGGDKIQAVPLDLSTTNPGKEKDTRTVVYISVKELSKDKPEENYDFTKPYSFNTDIY